MKRHAVDMQLHMTVKALAIIFREINCIIDELIKKANLLQEKGEEANYLLKRFLIIQMIWLTFLSKEKTCTIKLKT